MTEVWWRRDYVIWRNYEKSIFLTLAILDLLIRKVSKYAHISNWNFNADSMHIKFFGFAYANFRKRDFLLNAWANINFWIQIYICINKWFIWICHCFPNSVYHHAYAIIAIQANSKWIISMFAYAFKRKSRFSKFSWTNLNNLMCIKSELKLFVFT